MSKAGNQKKDALLGEPHGTANSRLRKQLLFQLVLETGRGSCFRCGEAITDIAQFTVEHKRPWMSSTDPREAFFDPGNIAFSHMKCNVGAPNASRGENNRGKRECPKGHPYDIVNKHATCASRACRRCATERMRRFRERAVKG